MPWDFTSWQGMPSFYWDEQSSGLVGKRACTFGTKNSGTSRLGRYVWVRLVHALGFLPAHLSLALQGSPPLAVESVSTGSPILLRLTTGFFTQQYSIESVSTGFLTRLNLSPQGFPHIWFSHHRVFHSFGLVSTGFSTHLRISPPVYFRVCLHRFSHTFECIFTVFSPISRLSPQGFQHIFVKTVSTGFPTILSAFFTGYSPLFFVPHC